MYAKYVKITFVKNKHYVVNLCDKFIFDVIEDDKMCYYCKYEPTTHNIEYYKELLIKNNLIKDVYSISVVMCEEIVEDCYKPNPEKFYLNISYKNEDREKIHELKDMLCELGFSFNVYSGQIGMNNNTLHFVFDENSPVKVVVRKA